eukprot:5711612-Prymnesium_polylepis.1
MLAPAGRCRRAPRPSRCTVPQRHRCRVAPDVQAAGADHAIRLGVVRHVVGDIPASTSTSARRRAAG